MESYTYLIIGGGAAGTSAAETLRKKDPQATIAVLNDEPYALYSRVMLSKPNFFLGEIPFDQVYLKGAKWYEDNRITYLGGKKAVSLDPSAKIVKTQDGASYQYGKLLLAVGVAARKWNVPGADKKGIHYLRTLDDGKAIMDAIKTCKNGITIGGGFIGFEMADLLKLAGLSTTVMLRESYFWEPTLDPVQGGMVEAALQKGGITLIKNNEIVEVKGGEHVESVVLKDGRELPCDMIICGIGISCPIDFIKAAGAQTSAGVLTDEYLKTSLPDVWAAGDIAEYQDVILEEKVVMGNWVNAHEQGRVAAENMAGAQTRFEFVSFYTTQGLGISIAFVGDARPLPDRTYVTRGSAELGWYERFFIVGKELVGATLINRTQDLTTIKQITLKNVDVSVSLDKLADPNFNIKELLPK